MNMLNEYFTWWAEQMLLWLPTRVARDRAGRALIIEAEAVQPMAGPPLVSLVLRRRGRERALGRFALGGPRALAGALPSRGRPAKVVLRLPPALLLEREVVLPLAAERAPEQVLAYEMDRITPFTSAEVFWTCAIVRRDRAHGRLHLVLSLITKASLQPLLAALGEAGIAPTTFEVTPVGGTTRQIALQRAAVAQGWLGRHTTTGLAGVCLTLAVAAVALPFVLQSRATARVEAQIAALRPRVEAAEALRRRIAASAAGVDVIAAERLRLGDTLAVLAAVTELLPDDTSLTDLTLRQGKLTLNGQSGGAARLIGALSADTVIRNPDFAAPVTRIDGGRDLFAIRAEIAR